MAQNKDRALREEAGRAGERNVVPGQAAIAALLRGLFRELENNSMGTPAGQSVREELGSLPYEQTLRELFPEEFAQGRLRGSEAIPTDILALLAPKFMRGFGMGGGAGVPRLGGPAPLEGEVLPPRPMLEGPLYDLGKRDAQSGPVSGFENSAVAAMQRARPVGRGGPFRAEDFGDYWTEGGYFAPQEGDFVAVNPVRNPEGYYAPGLVDEMSARMAAGDRGAFRHPLYGPTGDRPAYGAAGDGKGYWGNMPNPGLRPQMPRGPAPYGTPGEGPSPWERMPRPGIRREEGAVPRLPNLPAQAPQSEPALRPRLTVMAQGRGMVPREILGEFTEGRYLPPGQGVAALPPGMAGMRYEPLVAMGLAAGLPGLAGLQPHAQERGGITPGWPEILHGAGVTPAGTVMEEVRRKAHAMPNAKNLPKQQDKKPAPTSAKPGAQAADEAQGWDPNFNYMVTAALDHLFGTNEAERGRAYQQYYDTYGR